MIRRPPNARVVLQGPSIRMWPASNASKVTILEGPDRSNASLGSRLVCGAQLPCGAQGTAWSAGLIGAVSPERRLPPVSLGFTIAHDMLQGEHSSLRVEATALTPLVTSDFLICTSSCAPQRHVSQMAMFYPGYMGAGHGAYRGERTVPWVSAHTPLMSRQTREKRLHPVS